MAASAHEGATPYYFVPAPSRHPAAVAFGFLLIIFGASQWVNGAPWGAWVLLAGFAIWLFVLQQWFRQAIGDKAGVRRYGHAYVPLDEALSRVVIDLSGRPGLVWNVPFKRAMIGEFDVDLTHEFFQGFVNHAFVTLHIDNLKGENAHHQCETVFKAFARALRMALTRDERAAGTIPSTKGSL